MKKPAANKFAGIERFALEGIVGALAVSHDDAAFFVMAFETPLTECGRLHVGGEVAQRRAPAAGMLTLGDPFGFPDNGAMRARRSR